MSKKIALLIGVGIIIVVVIIGGKFILIKKQNQKKIKEQIAEQSMGKTNKFENSRLLEIAKQYVLKKPQLYLNREKFVDWNNYNELGSDFAKASPEWIISQKSEIEYVEPNKYKPPYDYLNDKYIVSWFFIPGCEENPNSTARPNWFNKEGLQCLGGYNLSVIINPDGTVNRAELNAML
jgi:hypothetical protein